MRREKDSPWPLGEADLNQALQKLNLELHFEGNKEKFKPPDEGKEAAVNHLMGLLAQSEWQSEIQYWPRMVGSSSRS